jgi:alpha-methylacyl-CoA racemase
MTGPLNGVRVLEFAGLGPTPFCGMLLSDLGADVVRVDRPQPSRPPAGPGTLEGYTTRALGRGRRSVAVNVKQQAGREIASALADRADVVLEGFRPGVMERLGLGPDDCLSRNPRLVYARMTGWGQSGQRAQTAGHDINYLAASGLLGTFGDPGGPPPAPLNLVADFGGGGALMALGIVSALWQAGRSGQGQVVDAAMVNGSALLGTMVYELLGEGDWHDRRHANLIDGAAPFYGTYETADGKYLAVGALEGQFYQALTDRLGIPAGELPDRDDREQWPRLRARLAAEFRRRTQAEWITVFQGSDACVTGVASLHEAVADPDNTGVFVDVGGVRQPAPVPRFSHTPSGVPRPARPPGADTGEVLGEIGVVGQRLRELRAAGVVG